MDKAKSFDISKQQVFQAYEQVKAKRGAAGIDEVSLKAFEENLKDNLYKIWNRLASGSYFPPAVKAVEIPKKNGGVRVLGIPTVADRIAQMVIKNSFEDKVEGFFLPDSYGYRPNKSAHDALEITRTRCWKSNWVLEFDIVGLFDNIDHELLIKAVEHHTKSKWELLYIKRWLKAPSQKESGEVISRENGVPQGGVISPVLANLFMHYAFDQWMEDKFPKNPWCRYADDAIIHCKTLEEAKAIKKELKRRLENCKLELHPEKTKIIYCKDSNRRRNYQNIQFTFLGYTFKPRKAKGKNGNSFTSFLPAISAKARKHIYQTIREWRILWMTNKEITEIADMYNPIIQGWLNYYGKFGKRELTKVLEHINRYLVKWLRRKYRKFKTKRKDAEKYLKTIAKYGDGLFAHWKVGIKPS